VFQQYSEFQFLNFVELVRLVEILLHYVLSFFKTSVTYFSLGESVQPSGFVDNFFIAGFCRCFLGLIV